MSGGQAEPAILGKLLVIQGVLDSLPERGAQAALLAAALRDVPGVSEVHFCFPGAVIPPHPRCSASCFLDRSSRESLRDAVPACAAPDGSKTRCLPLVTAQNLHGFLLLTLAAPEAFAPYSLHLANIVNFMAVLLDKQEVDRQLRKLLRDLEGQVAARTAELSKKNASLKRSRGQLRALAAHLQSVREDERTRLSRQVHDELGQVLTALKLDLAWLAARIRPDDTAEIGKVHDAVGLVGELIRLVRQIATELRPGVLDDAGLVSAVEWQAGEFERRTGISCRLVSTLPEREPDAEVATALFRILQEALTNVARHAGATAVTIELAPRNRQVVLVVTDNGRGITARELEDRRSLGLLGMRERAFVLGGRVTVTAGHGGMGTRVTASLPLRRRSKRMTLAGHRGRGRDVPDDLPGERSR
jgi:signal transduction histidine kinase